MDGGQRAVIFDRFQGVKKETTGEGTHVLLPWIQKPYVMSIRIRPRSYSSVTGTKDLQMVNITVRVLSRPKVEALPYIFRCRAIGSVPTSPRGPFAWCDSEL